jgi:hypothetical protein
MQERVMVYTPHANTNKVLLPSHKQAATRHCQAERTEHHSPLASRQHKYLCDNSGDPETEFIEADLPVVIVVDGIEYLPALSWREAQRCTHLRSIKYVARTKSVNECRK